MRPALYPTVLSIISKIKEKINTQDLKMLIKESVREVIKEERLALCDALIPYIDPAEQAEIETKYGVPTDYEEQELIDMTDWIQDAP